MYYWIVLNLIIHYHKKNFLVLYLLLFFFIFKLVIFRIEDNWFNAALHLLLFWFRWLQKGKEKKTGNELTRCIIKLNSHDYLAPYTCNTYMYIWPQIMKPARSIATPAGWDTSPSQVTPAFCQVSLTVCRYPLILLGEERHCERLSSVLPTKTNDPSQHLNVQSTKALMRIKMLNNSTL